MSDRASRDQERDLRARVRSAKKLLLELAIPVDRPARRVEEVLSLPFPPPLPPALPVFCDIATQTNNPPPSYNCNEADESSNNSNNSNNNNTSSTPTIPPPVTSDPVRLLGTIDSIPDLKDIIGQCDLRKEGNRKVCNFGYSYKYGGRVHPPTQFPETGPLHELRTRLEQQIPDIDNNWSCLLKSRQTFLILFLLLSESLSLSLSCYKVT
eukprot:sb/3470232/